MNEWNDNFKLSKRAPTDEELSVIEKELSGVDLEKDFEVEATVKLTEADINERAKSLTKKELKIIDEMTRIIEDPTYVSKVRKRRMAAKEEEDNEISFDDVNFGGFGTSFGEDFDPQY